MLGIALGSSQAGGYVTMAGNLLDWLHELAFCPIDYNPAAPMDEWSGDRGCGALYLSQQCVFRLAPRAGIRLLADARARSRFGKRWACIWGMPLLIMPTFTESNTCWCLVVAPQDKGDRFL